MYPIDFETVDMIISFCYASAAVCFAIGLCLLYMTGFSPLRRLVAFVYAVVIAPFVLFYFLWRILVAAIDQLGQLFADYMFARNTKQRMADIRTLGEQVREEMQQVSDEYLNMMAEAQSRATLNGQAKATQSAPSDFISNSSRTD